MSKYFVTGIGTGVGKTFIAAVLTEALKADYWKPVQCGTEGGTDTERVKALISNSETVFHEETYCFKDPVSPHMAAEKEHIKITMEYFVLPDSERPLIVEGAGGMMVPLNENNYVIDLARGFELEVILVVSSYLGCINHSILSLDYLVNSGISIKGLILNGKFDPEVRKAIISYSEIPILAEISTISEVNKDTVKNIADNIQVSLF
jgi:dethiobiotin synthetase